MPHGRRKKSDSPVAAMLKAILLACLVTGGLILIFALTLKWQWISTEHMTLVNLLIKMLGACCAGVVIARSACSRAWIWAGFSGLLYMAASFAIFALIKGGYTPKLENLTDLLTAFVCAACACVLVRLLRERQIDKKK